MVLASLPRRIQFSFILSAEPVGDFREPARQLQGLCGIWTSPGKLLHLGETNQAGIGARSE